MRAASCLDRPKRGEERRAERTPLRGETRRAGEMETAEDGRVEVAVGCERGASSPVCPQFNHLIRPESRPAACMAVWPLNSLISLEEEEANRAISPVVFDGWT